MSKVGNTGEHRTRFFVRSCPVLLPTFVLAGGRTTGGPVLSCSLDGTNENFVLFFFLIASVFTRNKVGYDSSKPNFHSVKQILLIVYLKINLLFAIFGHNKYTLTHHLFYKCDKLQKEHLQFTS